VQPIEGHAGREEAAARVGVAGGAEPAHPAEQTARAAWIGGRAQRDRGVGHVLTAQRDVDEPDDRAFGRGVCEVEALEDRRSPRVRGRVVRERVIAGDLRALHGPAAGIDPHVACGPVGLELDHAFVAVAVAVSVPGADHVTVARVDPHLDRFAPRVALAAHPHAVSHASVRQLRALHVEQSVVHLGARRVEPFVEVLGFVGRDPRERRACGLVPLHQRGRPRAVPLLAEHVARHREDAPATRARTTRVDRIVTEGVGLRASREVHVGERGLRRVEELIDRGMEARPTEQLAGGARATAAAELVEIGEQRGAYVEGPRAIRGRLLRAAWTTCERVAEERASDHAVVEAARELVGEDLERTIGDEHEPRRVGRELGARGRERDHERSWLDRRAATFFDERERLRDVGGDPHELIEHVDLVEIAEREDALRVRAGRLGERVGREHHEGVSVRQRALDAVHPIVEQHGDEGPHATTPKHAAREHRAAIAGRERDGVLRESQRDVVERVVHRRVATQRKRVPRTGERDPIAGAAEPSETFGDAVGEMHLDVVAAGRERELEIGARDVAPAR